MAWLGSSELVLYHEESTVPDPWTVASFKFHGCCPAGTFTGKKDVAWIKNHLARDWTSGIRLTTCSAPKLLPLLQLINNIFITLLYQCMSREGGREGVWSSWRRGIHYIIYIHSPCLMPKQPLQKKKKCCVDQVRTHHMSRPEFLFFFKRCWRHGEGVKVRTGSTTVRSWTFGSIIFYLKII